MKLRVIDIIILSITIGGCLSTGIYFLVEHLIGSRKPEEDIWTNKTIRQLSVSMYSNMISFADSLPLITYKNLCVTWETTVSFKSIKIRNDLKECFLI